MNIPCGLVLRPDNCECFDDPIRNISAEGPDVDVFIGFRDFRGNPPLGTVFAQLSCRTVCFSTVSQREADDCALRSAQDCVWHTWQPPVTPPIPPGPGGGSSVVFNTPGGVPPTRPRNPVKTFRNKAQTCEVDCPDGEPFTETVAPGTVLSLSQAAADEIAKSLACKRALEDQICILSDQLPSGCIGVNYSFQLQAEGGLPFDTQAYEWGVIAGDPPLGLSLDPSTGLISGSPTMSGIFPFIVEIIDAKGNSRTKSFSICVMEIVTGATLPKGTEGTAYAQPLIEEPGVVSSEVWTLTGGSLPDGITLASNGALSGTPTKIGMFNFILQVSATCGDSPATCSKNFSLEIVSGVNCMGNPQAVQDLVWTVFIGPFTMAGGDGSFNISLPGPQGSFSAETRCPFFCNPKKEPYDITIHADWTCAGHVFFDDSSLSLLMNGINHVGTVFPGSGARSDTIVVSVPSGVNTDLRLKINYGGILPIPGVVTLVGTVTIRPLTPP